MKKLFRVIVIICTLIPLGGYYYIRGAIYQRVDHQCAGYILLVPMNARGLSTCMDSNGTVFRIQH